MAIADQSNNHKHKQTNKKMITQTGTFYKLTEKNLKRMISKLTKTETVILLFLKTRNPFTDKFETIKTSEIAQQLELSQRTIQRAIKKLEKLKFIEYNTTEFQYRNISSEDNNDDHFFYSETNIKYDDLAVLNDTNKENNKQSINAQIKPLGVEYKQALAIAPKETMAITNVPGKLIASNQISQTQLRAWEWLPNGDWKNEEGKLDKNFHTWLAEKWVRKYGSDMFEAKANVLSYFRNDPIKLDIKWEQYLEETEAVFNNIDTRLNNGLTISEEQKYKAIARVSSLQKVNYGETTYEQMKNTVNVYSKVEQIEEIKEIKTEQYVEDAEGRKHKLHSVDDLPPVNPEALNMISNWVKNMKFKKYEIQQQKEN